jgi:hypothetical protein
MSLVLKPTKVEHPKVRNSHIIPRFYLNKFADAQKQTFVYEKARQARKKSTKTQCSEIDYFEYEVGAESSNNRHEIIFSRIEDLAGKAYGNILRGDPLEDQQTTAWALFVATLFLRSRKVRNQVAPRILDQLRDSYLAPEQVKNMQYDLFKLGHLISEGELAATVQKVWSQISSNPAYLQLAGSSGL